MDYLEVYKRNIGFFTPEEQERLRNSKVTIAGLGGVGGIQAVTLARYGIGEISIMDPGMFDLPGMNRQYGAMRSTIGRNKAEVMAEILQDVNPFMKVNVSTVALTEKSKLKEFMQNSNLTIDAIDCDINVYDQHVVFAEVARDMLIYNLFCPITGKGALLTVYDPKGMTFKEFWPKLPHNYDTPFSAHAGTVTLSGAWLATEAALMLTGKRKEGDIIKVPRVLYLSLVDFKGVCVDYSNK